MPQPVRLKAVVDQVISHAPDLRTLALVPERRAPAFRPGQFLHLAIDAYDPTSHWPESRIFSIASSPAQRQRLEVTFSAVGRFTKRMLDLHVGSEVWLKLPYGEFCVEASAQAPAVLVAGGTGVTPFIPLLSEPGPAPGPIALLYGARSADLLIYREAVEHAARRWPELRVTLFVENGQGASVRGGRLRVEDALTAAHELPTPDKAVYYLSGPPAMLHFFQQGLAERGIDPQRIRVDAWGN